jgi:hypothetical protein
MAKKKRKLTPEERAELAALEARSEANLLKLRELVANGWAELEAKREAARRGEIELDPAWASPPREA